MRFSVKTISSLLLAVGTLEAVGGTNIGGRAVCRTGDDAGMNVRLAFKLDLTKPILAAYQPITGGVYFFGWSFHGESQRKVAYDGFLKQG